MKRKQQVISVYVFLLVAVPLFAQTAYLRTTTNANRWADGGTSTGTAWVSTTNYVEIFPTTEYQTVMGWGGTIQEKHWTAIQPLSAAGKDSVNRALFDTSGCNITFLRCPIGCCDFDLNEAPMSLNETAGDYQMTKFSLKRDSTRKIPLIKMAQAINPNLRFWGCPWSPPRWMHDDGNFDRGNMKTDAQTMTAYALYLEKYVLGYKDAGINVEWVCCQNEPNIADGGYPKCGWTNSGELNFYKNYMIPLFKQDNISTRIILGVFCCGTYADWITYFMNDQTVAPFVGVTSHSYQNPDWGTQSVAAYPSIPFFETEAPFGPGPPGNNVQDWATGVSEYDNVSSFMAQKASVYTMWNMVNDQTGQSGFGWAQNVMIQVNSSTKQVTYNPHFYAYKHYSHFVKPGAKVVKHSGTTPGNTNAFRNPNGDIILVLRNSGTGTSALTVKVSNTMYKVSLPGSSFNTLRIASGTAVQKKKLEKTIIPALNDVRICNATLSFALSAAKEAREMNVTLSDLQGRTVWTGRQGGNAILGEQQTFAIQPAQGGLLPGTYLLTVRIKNKAGAIKTFENKVTAVN